MLQKDHSYHGNDFDKHRTHCRHHIHAPQMTLLLGEGKDWSIRRFTRLTNEFSKRYDSHCYMVEIYYAYYNFCRVHQTLRVTPAMEAGFSDHVWTVEELTGVLETKTKAA